MIGVVIVSHSAKIAEGVRDLAAQISQGKVQIAPAGGTGDPDNPLGTDAFQVLQAIESVYTSEGVLVLMDLGSAVLSAETALDLLDAEKRPKVQLCAAPLVEGAVAAVALAAANAPLSEIVREAQSALGAKAAHLIPPAPGEAIATPAAAFTRVLTVSNRLGLHARPAAQFVRLARGFQAIVNVENLTAGTGPVDGASISGLLGLALRQGQKVRIRTSGTTAEKALAGLADFIDSGCGEKDEAAEPLQDASSPAQATTGQLRGIPASAGIAAGPLVRLRPVPLSAAPDRNASPEAEWQRLASAIARAENETRGLLQWAKTHAGEREAALFDAHLLMLEDPALIESARRRVTDQHESAEAAWEGAMRDFADHLAALDDPYMRARAIDVTDTATRVLRCLSGGAVAPLALKEPAIVAAHDLPPSAIRELDPLLVLGICLETGSASAHSVILARATGIPVVTGLGAGLSAIAEGTLVGIDGESGAVWISPEAAQVRALSDRRQAWLDGRRAADAERHRPAQTRDGHKIRVFANINSVEDAARALEAGAEGVGVLRTEFLFLERDRPPDEEEQFAAYRDIAELMHPLPVVIRTLDAGGDKQMPFVDTGEEDNPFLGWRGIRVTLSCRDLLKTQLRAILRAGAGHGVDVLLPMISTLAELRTAKEVLREVELELTREQKPFRQHTRIGVMIEVPSAVAVADQLARESDFFSIGTNDLVQYVMAADRTNARVAQIANAFQPAVLRMLRQTVDAARNAGIEAALCGEMAADPLATPLLVGLGIEEFSVSAPLIPEVKRTLARWTLPEAERIARHALSLESSEAVRCFLSEPGLSGG